MEWAKETAQSATETVMGNETANKAYNTTKDTANKAYGATTDAAAHPGDTATAASDQALDYVPDVTKESTTTSAILNSAPFRSFKPDPATVWQGHLIYIILAAASTITWWTFIFAADYFQYLYPGSHIIRLFVFAYFVPWLIVYLIICSVWREGSCWVKVNVGGAIAIVALLVFPFLDGFFMGERGTTATFWVTLVLVAIAGCADAISQGSLLGISAELPQSFTKAYCTGVAASGVFVFIVRLILKASLSSSATGLRISGMVYFCIAALFVMLALALFAYVHNMPEMGYYTSLNLGSFETVRLLIQDEGSVTKEVAAGAAIAALAAGRSSPAKPLHWKAVLNHVQILSVSSFLTSVITLTIFPGVLAEDLVPWEKLGDYSSLVLMGTFAVFDVCGRVFTSREMEQKHSTVLGLALVRLLLVVFFIVGLLFDDSFVSSVILMMILTALLGFSNGYLVSVHTVLLPKSTPSDIAETAGILNAVFMSLGLLVGAGLSWILILI
jgi:equilibrative nucleoside transporter 1/2/3